MALIGNVTDAERMAMRICADAKGECECEKIWGFPRDAIRDCSDLLANVRAGLLTVKAEGGR